MRVAAFDSKPYNRGTIAKVHGEEESKKYTGYSTQLGAGVIISDADAFASAFAAEFARLKGEFGIDTSLPFMPAGVLLKCGRRKATALADRLVTSVGGMIEGVHCSFVSLSPKTYATVQVGGGDSARDVPTRPFIDSLGPMFSYLTAQSCAGLAEKIPGGAEIRIRSFASRQTRAWDSLERLGPKVYWKGDECDAAIACASLLAFLTDAKLYSAHLRLEPENVKRVWEPHPFDVSVGVYEHANLGNYAWYSNEMIDIRPHLAKPTVFLAVDDLADPAQCVDTEEPGGENCGGPGTAGRGVFRRAVEQSDTYCAIVRKAFELSASLKMIRRDEDVQLVRDRDVFVYVGEESRRMGKALQDSVDIAVMSGLELRRSIKSN